MEVEMSFHKPFFASFMLLTFGFVYHDLCIQKYLLVGFLIRNGYFVATKASVRLHNPLQSFGSKLDFMILMGSDSEVTIQLSLIRHSPVPPKVGSDSAEDALEQSKKQKVKLQAWNPGKLRLRVF